MRWAAIQCEAMRHDRSQLGIKKWSQINPNILVRPTLKALGIIQAPTVSSGNGTRKESPAEPMIDFVPRTFSLCPYLEFPASSSCFHRPFYPLPFSLSFSIECNGGGYSDDTALETEKPPLSEFHPPG